jgi:prepilin-type N-terminal cleavage/methylation domain-containing protein
MKKLQNSLPAGRQGFTLMEILIVVAILMILLMATLLNLRGQAARAQDSRRKTDLYMLRKALEDYYNDHNAFPYQQTFNQYHCGSADMAPYLTQVPCDPATKSLYGYFPSVSGGYRICAKLADTTDPAIGTVGCGGGAGCGVGAGYNYCLGSGVTASAVGTEDEIFDGGGTITPAGGTPTPGGGTIPVGGGTPTPNLNPGNHVVCSSGGLCKWYDNPQSMGCPISWPSSCPLNACTNPGNRCTDIIN